VCGASNWSGKNGWIGSTAKELFYTMSSSGAAADSGGGYEWLSLSAVPQDTGRACALHQLQSGCAGMRMRMPSVLTNASAMASGTLDLEL
jgi:hypothetical protein